MKPDDRLDVVELNDDFVARLHERFQSEPLFQAVAERSQILHQNVEAIEATRSYDLIVSGLPLNNFSVAEVERILAAFEGLSKPGGVLSFFEYVAVRKAKALVSGPDERVRLRGIAAALDRLFQHEVRRDCVLRNVTPAWVHHVTLGDGEGVELPAGSSLASCQRCYHAQVDNLCHPANKLCHPTRARRSLSMHWQDASATQARS